MSDRPEVSIILVATESAEAVERFLSQLSGNFEVVVVAPRDLPGRSNGAILRTTFPREGEAPAEPIPGITFDFRQGSAGASPSRGNLLIEWAEPGKGTPRLRKLGLDAASGEILVFVEDSVVPGGNWPGRLASARIGTGPVAVSCGAAPWNRAVYLFEYGEFAPAFHAAGTPPRRLAGNNFSLGREVAESLGSEIHEHEVPLESAVFVADAEVVHVRNYGVVEALRDRFRFGFDYGSNRWRGRPRVLGIPLVAAVAVAQTILMSRLRRLPEFRPIWIMAIPMLCLILAWSLGEGMGLLFGRRSGTSGRTEAPGESTSADCTDGPRAASAPA